MKIKHEVVLSSEQLNDAVRMYLQSRNVELAEVFYCKFTAGEIEMEYDFDRIRVTWDTDNI